MEQLAINLYPETKQHRACRGCCHLWESWKCRNPYSTKETVEYGCDLSPYGYHPVGAPRRARGCPDGLPEMWETFEELYKRTDYCRLHPLTGVPVRMVFDKPMLLPVVEVN